MDRSRRGADGSAGVVLRLTLHATFGALVALLAFGMTLRPAYAQQDHIPRGQPIPENIRWVNATATGANTSASASWTSAMGQTSHHKFPVHVNAATLGRLANAAVRRGLPLLGWASLFREVINVAGWAIDELGQQVVNPGVPQQPLGDTAYCFTVGATWHCAASPGSLSHVAHLRNTNAYAQPCRVRAYNPRAVYACMHITLGTEVDIVMESVITKPVAGWGSGYVNSGEYVEPSVISDADLGNVIKSSPQIVDAVLLDPQTGAPIRTQELVNALNALRTQLEAAHGQTPVGTDLIPAEDYADSTPSQTEWPEFCSWAKRVCDWMFDLEPEPEHPDLPYVEVDPTEMEDFDIGLGQGACPAPYTTAVLDGEFEIQWDGLCGFVEYLRPLLIGLAWVVAAFIVANSAKRG